MSNKSYVQNLTDAQRKVFEATPQELRALLGRDDYYLNNFVHISLVLCELERIEKEYADILDQVADTEIKLLQDIMGTLDDLFVATVTVGTRSVSVPLSLCDSKEFVYAMLLKLKESAFEYVIENCEV